MSGIFNMLSGASQPNGMSIMMQAIGAAMRGESPQAFIRNLANTHPALRGIDTNDLYGSAEKLAKERGADINVLSKQIDSAVASVTNK